MTNIKKSTLSYPYYTFNNKINIKNFDPNLLSIDKISFKNAEYITTKSLDSENIDSTNPLCLIFNDASGYIIEESKRHKYLVFASTKDKSVLTKYAKVWDEIKNQIETINDSKPIKNKKIS